MNSANPNLSQADANSAAWDQGVKLVKRAIEERLDFAFETTLGANTIPRLLAQATAQGIEIYTGTLAFPAPSFTSNAYKRESAKAATTSLRNTSGGATSTAAST